MIATRSGEKPDTVTLFHAPRTRSSGALALLEEIGAPYELHVLDLQAGEGRRPDYLAVNPMGKVPAIRHCGAVVTEQVAIFLYCADAFPAARLAPALDDPLRGPYLRWMVYYAACYEPALVDRAMKREPGATAMSPYGSFGAVMATINTALAAGPYILGERFSAADVLWGTALRWGVMFAIVPETPAIAGYVARATGRPAAERAAAIDARLVAEQTETTQPETSERA